jgi:uroporphyrinogen decarboxylase
MTNKTMLNVLKGQKEMRVPIWFMRQAGRYLPEYREIRSKTKSFMDAVLTPEIASEITLQPLRRFDLDAAIIFSDILVVPHAMGIDVEFHEGIGPVIEYDFNYPQKKIEWKNTERFKDITSKVCQTIAIVKENLSRQKPHVTTIGFAGAPWTVACYMLEKNRKKGGDFEMAREIAYQPQFKDLIDDIIDATIDFLLAQIDAGAEVVKVFDSHAGLLGENQFKSFVVDPMTRIVKAIRDHNPNVPIIGFPRRAGILYEKFAIETKVDCVAVDHTPPLSWIRENVQKHCVVQGNLDNICLNLDLRYAQNIINDSVVQILSHFHNKAQHGFIFNLGHGCMPSTKIENIEFLIKTIRENS